MANGDLTGWAVAGRSRKSNCHAQEEKENTDQDKGKLKRKFQTGLGTG